MDLPTPLPAPLRTAPPLNLILRFSTATPDLALDIPTPDTVRIAALKQQVRPTLPPADRSRVLRLIYQGRMLDNSDVLGDVVRPPRDITPSGYISSSPETSDEEATVTDVLLDPDGGGKKGKGKRKGKRKARNKGKSPVVARPRTYLNASLGPPLSAAALAKEASVAAQPVTPPRTPSPYLNPAHPHGAPPRSLTPEPRGFDRFLAAGLSAAEVNQLRLQFNSIQASRFPPDAMPDSEALLRMEEEWIDNGEGAEMGGAGGATGENGEVVVVEDSMDALVNGLIMGFFWPMGCFVWMLKEEGMWSKRKHYAVWVGVVFAFTIGFLRALGAEGGGL